MSANKASAPGTVLANHPTRPLIPSTEKTDTESTAPGGILRLHYIAREDAPPAQQAAWRGLWIRLLSNDETEPLAAA